MSLKLRPGVFAATRYRRLVFSFHSRLRCSMELNAVSVAPWVGHVMALLAHIWSHFKLKWGPKSAQKNGAEILCTFQTTFETLFMHPRDPEVVKAEQNSFKSWPKGARRHAIRGPKAVAASQPNKKIAATTQVCQIHLFLMCVG